MELFIGGAYQGQEECARNRYPKIVWIKGEECSRKDLLSAEGVLDFHRYIKKVVERGEDTGGLAEEIIRENPNLVLVLDEVGYGIVPVDPLERLYRESLGRVCIQLAKHARHVYRAVCGIEVVIK